MRQIYKTYPLQQKFFNEPDFFVAKNESLRHARRRLSLVWVFRRLPVKAYFSLRAACAAAKRAMGTRNGEQLT